MEKDREINIVTQKAKKIIQQQKLKIRIDIVYNKKNINNLINTTPCAITIYDITYIKAKSQRINIKDHINKTGENPLIGKQKFFEIDFIDITKLYNQKQKGVTTTSIGSNATRKEFMKTKNPSTEASNIAILCYALGHKKIKAKLINCLEFF